MIMNLQNDKVMEMELTHKVAQVVADYVRWNKYPKCCMTFVKDKELECMNGGSDLLILWDCDNMTPDNDAKEHFAFDDIKANGFFNDKKNIWYIEIDGHKYKVMD